jgi:hypothetical protein
MNGRLRRLTILHWVPVVVELWPVYPDFTRMTITPRIRVFASKRYFRLGHQVLDLLWAHLAELSAPTDVSPRRADHSTDPSLTGSSSEPHRLTTDGFTRKEEW